MARGLLWNALDLSGALYNRGFKGRIFPDFNLIDRTGYLC
jgi:hypothetical protein